MAVVATSVVTVFDGRWAGGLTGYRVLARQVIDPDAAVTMTGGPVTRQESLESRESWFAEQVSQDATHPAFLCPAPVPIHDDRDVAR